MKTFYWKFNCYEINTKKTLNYYGNSLNDGKLKKLIKILFLNCFLLKFLIFGISKNVI